MRKSQYRGGWYRLQWDRLRRDIKADPDYALFDQARKQKNFHACFAIFMNRIAQFYQEGITLADLLKRRHIKRVGIYGAGVVGGFVCQDLLKDGEIHLEYVVDKARKEWRQAKVYRLDDIHEEQMDKADIMIISPLFADYEDIFMELFQKGVTIPMIAIEDILYGQKGI